MPYCVVCGTEGAGNYCPKCGKVQTGAPRNGPGPNPYASAPPPVYSSPYVQNNEFHSAPSHKDQITALLLCIFLGWLGMHHFYSGRVGYGILYVFTFGLFGIGWLTDTILLATGAYKDQYGRPLRNRYN